MVENASAYHHENRHRAASGLRSAVEIRHDAGDDRDGRAGKGADKEAKHEESRPVRREGAGEHPEAEDGESSERDPSAAKLFA